MFSANESNFFRQVRFGTLDNVKEAKAKGPNINAVQRSETHILHACVGSGNPNKKAILEYLISLPGIKVDAKNNKGNTALDIAITKNDRSCVAILHTKGCTVKQENEEALNAILQEQEEQKLLVQKEQKVKSSASDKSSNNSISFSRIVFPIIPSVPFFFYSADPKYIACFSASSYVVSLPWNGSISDFLKLNTFYLAATGINTFGSNAEDWKVRISCACITNIMIVCTFLYSAFGMQDDIAR